jgi:hypothetical protein
MAHDTTPDTPRPSSRSRQYALYGVLVAAIAGILLAWWQGSTVRLSRTERIGAWLWQHGAVTGSQYPSPIYRYAHGTCVVGSAGGVETGITVDMSTLSG